ncbi:MAG TPA: ABC transporter permease [Candidatus Acidoferrales bacterium]|jgi:predicted permease|nr:ABC transporter permease [Candidatus Acidoferrales bacterium]
MRPWPRLRRPRRLDEELDEEIRAHLRMAAQDRIDRGELRAEAERNARRELGNEALIKEVTRDMWGWTTVERLVQDLKYALRQMRRSPGFSIVAVLTLALGLAAITVMFSIVNGVLLEPLKYRDPGRLYLARTVPPARANLAGNFPVNARHYMEWRHHCLSCESVSLIQFQDLTLVGAGRPAKLPALDVSFNFFQTLGVQPSLGRDFLPENDTPGHFGEVILTDALWRSRFAGDPAIIGRKIQINGEPHTVVGVMPPELHLPKGDEWGAYFGPAAVPLIFRPGVAFFQGSQGRAVGNLNYTSVIRLKPGVPVAQAIAELNALLADFVRQFNLETKTTLIPLQEQVTRNARSSLWLLLGTVGAVLLIVCVNVGNLMIVRTTGRYREAAVRMALGASRGQLFGLVLKEALVLVAAGGAAGLALAYAGLRVFVASAPIGLPRLEEVQMDWRVLAFAGLAIAFCAVACGLVPAWRLARVQVQDSLKAGAATSTEAGGKLRVREIMVSLEVALSAVLLIVGGLLMLSFFRVMRVDKGFEVAHIITQDVSYLSPKYAHSVRRSIIAETVAKLAQLPGVQVAAAINRLPLLGDDWVSGLEDPDQPARPMESAALANFRFATPDYWKAMGIPLKMGRFLDESDKGRPTAVISERAARYLWPNQSPIGKHVRGVGQPSPTLEVMGVVGEVRASGLEHNPPMMVYEHYWRMQPVGMSFVLRTQSSPLAVAGAIRSVLASADPEMAIPQPTTMEQILEESVAARKFQMDLAVGFAAAALLLASLGIYGVISFAVARRTPEIGIRIALGAPGRQLMAMVLRQGMRPVLIGLAAGVACGLLVSRAMASQLFGVAPWDPVTICGAAAMLLTVAASACWIPARRATRIDPLTALRFE